MRLILERYGKDFLKYERNLSDKSSEEFEKLSKLTHEALDRMLMQSDLRDIYHGVQINGFARPLDDSGLINEFHLQLSDNVEENRLRDVFKKYLRSNNYSIGGTELYASRESLEGLDASDFDECNNLQYHDCSENAQCFNLKGTYTCSCKEGYADMSENILYPGRICSAEQVGCEICNYHGTCNTREDDKVFCDCFQWYAGERCQVNLKGDPSIVRIFFFSPTRLFFIFPVMLIALVTLGIILFALLIVCMILTCRGKKQTNAGMANGMSFIPQRMSNPSRRTTLDRKAMIQDSSSESGQSDNNTLPYVAKVKVLLKAFNS